MSQSSDERLGKALDLMRNPPTSGSVMFILKAEDPTPNSQLCPREASRPNLLCFQLRPKMNKDWPHS